MESENAPGTTAGGTPAAQGPLAPTVFARKASGLIRSVSFTDVFGFNVLNVNIGIGTIWILLFIPAMYPGANLWLAVLIGWALTIPTAFAYARLSAIYPRSGGDYIYMTRVLHPSVGFGVNLAFIIYALMFISLAGTYTAQWGIAPLLRTAAAYWQSDGLLNASDWVASTTGTFVVAIAVIALYSLMLLLAGNRLYFRIQLVTLVFAMAGLAVFLIVALTMSRNSAFLNINALLANIGAKSLDPLRLGQPPSFSWVATLQSSVWVFLNTVFCCYSASIGGEVKRPARTQLVGMQTGLAWAAIWMFVLTLAEQKLLGSTFLNNLAGADPAAYGLSSTPTFGELTSLALNQGVLAVILMVVFTTWGYAWLPMLVFTCSRCMFAWSLDRLMPRWLAGVNARFHTPQNAIAVVVVLASVWAVLVTYGGFAVLNGIIAYGVSFLLVPLCAALLPYRNRELWKSSPGSSLVLGLPSLTWVGILGMIGPAAFLYLNITDPLSGTSYSANPGMLATWVGLILGCIALYWVITAIQARRGVNVSLSFSEIPPE